MTRPLTALLENPEKLQPLLQRLPAVLSVVFLVACAHILSQITWMLLTEPETASAVTRTRAPLKPASNASSQQAFRQLAGAHLFGELQRTPLQQTTTEAPETRLNLVLRGVLAAEPMELASAIISSGKNGKEEIYGVGDRMPGGVEIREIHAEHVILQRQGRLETLRLIRDPSGDNSNEKLLNMLSSSKPSSPAEALTNIRKDIMSNPTSFGDYALPVVVKENGKQIGYRLQPQKKGQMLSEIGLQPTDVITSVNGVKLDQPQNGMGALRKLSTANRIDLVVKRNGAEVPINIQLQ